MNDRKVLEGISISETNVPAFKTGSWRRMDPVYAERTSPCTDLCPCAENIPTWMRLVREKNFEGAWRELVRENPFPLVCGRVCYRFCEAKCNREHIDDRVSINAVERFLGEYAIRNGLRFWGGAIPKHNIRVAIVGGGPAGLSAAHTLAREGCRVTIFDEHKELGGVLRYGIPEYRLPKALLTSEVKAMFWGLGIRVRTNYRVTAERFDRMLARYDHVIVALGAHRPKTIRTDQGKEFPLMSGLQFLSKVATGEVGRFADQVQSVCVIGGGNTAIDVSRTALRLGAKEVTVLYRRTEEAMPAHRDEVLAAQREGVRFKFLTLPVEAAIGERSRVTLTCVSMELVSADDGKTIVPKRTTAPAFTLHCDHAFMAIGEDVDRSLLGAHEHQFSDEHDLHEGKILQIGDALYGPRSVSEAIASGKKAARKVLALHAAESQGSAPGRRSEVVGVSDIKFGYLNVRRKDPHIAGERSLSPEEFVAFKETTRTIDEDEAVREADRCINCGTCIACDRCLSFCPDYSIVKQVDGTYAINYDMCKGCGLCADVCERGVILLKKEGEQC